MEVGVVLPPRLCRVVVSFGVPGDQRPCHLVCGHVSERICFRVRSAGLTLLFKSTTPMPCGFTVPGGICFGGVEKVPRARLSAIIWPSSLEGHWKVPNRSR